MPNRTIPPIIHHDYQLHLPMPEKHLLKNGIPVYEVRMGTQDIVKLELVLNAGRTTEQKQLVSRATASLLKEGTVNLSSAKIAETIDFYGGTLSIPISLDTSNIALYSLTKHFEKLLPIVAEILTMPTFPEEELQAYKENAKQKLKVNLTKNDVVAYREITERIFGSTHPYGYNSNLHSLAALTREDLVAHFEQTFHADNCFIIISGNINDQLIKLLDTHLGHLERKGVAKHTLGPTPEIKPQQLKIKLDNSVQTAIRIGRKVFNKKHKDFKGFMVLNTILGGYFGSRLMMNIRETKGYTYNIFSALDAMVHDGYFYIGTEVGNEFVEDTTKEIYKELELLQTTLIKPEELKMVKNYLLGNMLHLLDGPMNVSDVIKTILSEDLQFTDFQDLVTVVKNISEEEIRELAQKYFQKEDLWEVVVGI